jgi:hypothetical protein
LEGADLLEVVLGESDREQRCFQISLPALEGLAEPLAMSEKGKQRFATVVGIEHLPGVWVAELKKKDFH